MELHILGYVIKWSHLSKTFEVYDPSEYFVLDCDTLDELVEELKTYLYIDLTLEELNILESYSETGVEYSILIY